jgi:hypothetical protein
MSRYRVRVIVAGIGLLSVFSPLSTSAADTSRPTVIFDRVASEVSAPAPAFGSQATDLWVTLADLKRATGFEVKPQGICRKELCFPLPKDKRSAFLSKNGAATWFNLTAFARMLHQAVANDAPHRTWYIGPRPDVQNAFLDSLEAPNFTLPDMNGKQHSLSDFRGKKVLLITWASW